MILPDYYNQFVCKCGDCRTCCCSGWNVTTTQKEYFSLLGVDCSTHLRKSLDIALYIPKYSDPQRYAVLKQTFLGECHLRLANGFCSIHKELGSDYLPSICRLYPRYITPDNYGYGCMANSCEKVIELLLASDTFSLNKATVNNENLPYITYPNIQEKLRVLHITLDVLNMPNMSFKEAFMSLYNKLELSQCKQAQLLLSLINCDDNGYAFIYEAIKKLNDISTNFSKYATIFITALNNKSAKNLEECSSHLATVVDNYYNAIRNICLNHIIFIKFPNIDTDYDICDNFIELLLAIHVSTLICGNYCVKYNTLDSFVDCIASLNRCYEHSDELKYIVKYK